MHSYQPLWTLVGAGVCSLEESQRSTAQLIPSGVAWLQEKVLSFAPEQNNVVAEAGTYSYEAQVVSPGIQVNWDGIEGLRETLGKNGVVSNYSEQILEKTWEEFQKFKGGRVLFTFPNTPIKCGGAPQKIMYLMGDYLRRNGLREKSSVEFFSAADGIFGVPKYKAALGELVERRDIKTHFKKNLVAVYGERKIAVFEDLLSHQRYKNIFGLGDASSLPTARTGAAIRKQAPVQVENLLAHFEGRELKSSYDGYSSCPIVTGYGTLILAEFDYDGKPCETFPFDQAKERWSMYQLKRHLLPNLYWYGMMRGLA